MDRVHDQIESLIAAYAMGAVPEEEIPAIRAHILSCEECFAEAESYTEALAALAASVEPVPLAKGFADQVLEQVREGSGASASSRPVAAALRWRFLVPGVAALMTAALFVTGAALIRSADRQRDYRRVVASLVTQGNRLSLAGPGGAEAVVAPSDGGLVLVAVDLGEAPSGRDYQLWLIDEGVATPSVTFDVTGSVVIVESDEDLEDFEGAAITVEPDGGSRQPTTEPVLSS